MIRSSPALIPAVVPPSRLVCSNTAGYTDLIFGLFDLAGLTFR